MQSADVYTGAAERITSFTKRKKWRESVERSTRMSWPMLFSFVPTHAPTWVCECIFVYFRLFGRVYSAESGNELSRVRNERFPHLAGATIPFFPLSLSPIPEYALAERGEKIVLCAQREWLAACCMHIERSVRRRVLDAAAWLSVPHGLYNNTVAQCVRARERKRHHSPLVLRFYIFRCFKKVSIELFFFASSTLFFFRQSFFVRDYFRCFSFPISTESVCAFECAHMTLHV